MHCGGSTKDTNNGIYELVERLGITPTSLNGHTTAHIDLNNMLHINTA